MKNPLKPSWCASLGTATDCFGLELGERKDSRRVWRILVFCDEFMTHFHESVSL